MKTKIDVYQQKETPIHRWNVYNTFTETQDKYDLYFKNRFNTANGWEKYDNLATLPADYVLYKLYEEGTGVQNSVWEINRPDLVNFDEYTRTQGTIEDLFPNEDIENITYITAEDCLPTEITTQNVKMSRVGARTDLFHYDDDVLYDQLIDDGEVMVGSVGVEWHGINDARREYKYVIETEQFFDISRTGGELYRCKIVPYYRITHIDENYQIIEVLQDWQKATASTSYGHYAGRYITVEKSTIEWKHSSLNDDNYLEKLGEYNVAEYDNYLTFKTPKEYVLKFIWNSKNNSVDVFVDVYGAFKDLSSWNNLLFTAKTATLKQMGLHTNGRWYKNTYGFIDFAWKVPILCCQENVLYPREEFYSFILPIKINKYTDIVYHSHTDSYKDVYGNTPTAAEFQKMVDGIIGNFPLGTPYCGFRDFNRNSGRLINYSIPVNYFEGFNGGYYESLENKTLPIEDYNELSYEYLNGDIISLDGDITYKYIDINSVRYGYSYNTETFEPYSSQYPWEARRTNGYRAFISYGELQNMYENWYTQTTWRPNHIYEIEASNPTLSGAEGTYTRITTPYQNLNWHPIGIKPYSFWYILDSERVALRSEYDEENKADYIFEVIFELAEPIPANTFYLLDDSAIMTNILPIYQEADPEKIYRINQNYLVIKPTSTVKEWKYCLRMEYENSDEEKWLMELVYSFPQGMKIPTKHWPQMLYEEERYKDVEVITSNEMTYPNFGYYPPKEEMLPDNFKTELEEGVAVYRYIGDINEYYSTVKAGSIYLPVGTDIEEELLLTPYDERNANDLIETNPYGYKYIGEEEVVQKNALTRVATSTDFGAYPKDGIYTDDYWYEYIGTDEQIEYLWGDKELRSNANFNIDINSNQDFTIGDVAGASFRVDIQGNIRDTIQYLGRKVRLNYDFENQNEFKDFGLFTIEDVKFMNHQVSTITAYDNIKKFDAPVYEYLTSDNVKPLYPMTAKTLFQLMCEYCEVPYYTSMEFLNSDKLCYGAFGDANLTARQALSYVAELAGGYITCDKNGFAVIKTIKPFNNLKNVVNKYTTDYENILPLLNSTDLNRAEIIRKEYAVSDQVNQRMDIFPTEVIDSIVFNNADTISFINYRKELNAIYDLSDNPFLAFVDNQSAADEITNGILDQIAILIPPLYNEDTKFYAGEIELKNFDYSTFGTKQIVQLLDKLKGKDYFIPTTISINESGITLTAKGQPKYSTKIVNSELAKQVNSLKMNIKEIKLTIPDALADTLDNHGQQISTIETDLGAVQEDLGAVQESVSSLDTALETQKTETNTQFSNVQRRDDGQDDRLDALEAKDTAIDGEITNLKSKDTAIEGSISTLSSTVGTNTTNISNLTTTVGGLPTKTYVDNLNQVNSITNGWKLSIGEDEVSFYTDNGYLFISDGTTTWKLKLEVNA